MKIQYKKKRLRYELYFGLAWAFLGFLSLLSTDELRWIDYGYLLISLLYVGRYIYESRNQYLVIEAEKIYKKSLFSKAMDLSKIESISSVAGNYILKTEGREMKIEVGLIDESSLLELNRILSQLDLEPGKSIFA
ncbi:hypothetical protein [Labilibaculum sp.]|uniref:hypothetical protein n=1 Tax=Labilibaculum sp. TaxID=2060723 RepID=UPI00356A4B8A